MYIRDEHPLRYRARYHVLRGMGIGPEIVVSHGADVVLQRTSPPLEGLMSPMTDAYTTLVPTMAPLPARADFAVPAPRRRILPVEMAVGFGTCLGCS